MTPDPTTTRCSGSSSSVVDVAPGQDAFAVGHGGGQHPRGAAGGEQHDVGLEGLGHRAVRVDDLDAVRAAGLVGGEAAGAGDHGDALAHAAACVDVGGLLRGQVADAAR